MYFLKLIVLMLMSLIAFIAMPLLVLFARPKEGRILNNSTTGIEPKLPSWLSWFDTFDNSLLGDSNWREKHTGKYGDKLSWLYRNTLYGFKRDALGVSVFGEELTFSGDPAVNTNNGVYGVFKGKMGKAWQYKRILKLGPKRLSIDLGWILTCYANTKPVEKEKAMFQFSIRIK